MLTSPRATFEAVVRKPNVFAMLALVALIVGSAQAAMNITDRGKQMSLDFQEQQMEKLGFTVTDQIHESLVNRQKYALFTSYVGAFVGFPIVLLIMSGILYAVFNAIMGGTASFKQVMAVVTHTTVISAVGAVFATAMNYSRGSISTSVANIGMLLPMLREKSFLANLAGWVDVFQIWWIVTLAIGLGVLYKRKTSNVATGLFAVFAVIAVCISYFFNRG